MTALQIILVILVISISIVAFFLKIAPEGEQIEGVGFVRKDDEA